jgi:protein-S-isoprenylcysteine O-methyltransferase Ste14
MHDVLLASVTVAAFVRSAWLLIGLIRVIPVHVRARTTRWGLAEVLTFVELPVFLGLTCLLVLRPPEVLATGAASIGAAGAGSFLALAGLAVSLWAIYTTVRRGVILDAGHFVKDEHPLVTTGAYGFVRNPMYLGIILIWFGIAVAFQNAWLLTASALYVVPALWFYIRAEEQMMAHEFGDQFAQYTHSVGRLLPKLHWPAA